MCRMGLTSTTKLNLVYKRKTEKCINFEILNTSNHPIGATANLNRGFSSVEPPIQTFYNLLVTPIQTFYNFISNYTSMK
jgi:hypothetical protein